MNKVYQVIIDRPIGYIDKFGNQYPINYGYIPNLLAEAGESKMFTSFPKMFGSL